MDKQDKKSTETTRGNTTHDEKKQQARVRNIDRQEGKMNNGELGGNMGQKREEEKK